MAPSSFSSSTPSCIRLLERLDSLASRVHKGRQAEGAATVPEILELNPASENGKKFVERIEKELKG